MPESMNQRIARLYKVSDRELALYEKSVNVKILEAYKESLTGVRESLGMMYEKFGDKVDYKTMASYQRLTNLEIELTEKLRAAGVKAKASIEKSIMTHYSQSYYSAGYIGESSLNVAMGFGLLNEEVIKASLVNPYTSIQWPARLTKNVNIMIGNVRDQVTTGLIQGFGYSKTARLLKGSIERSTKDTLRIVSTESHRAKSMGRAQSYEKMNEYAEEQKIKIRKKWLATLDGKTRASHRDMDGELADEEGIFTFPDGLTCLGPGLTGVGAEDIGCRCTDITEIEDIPQKFRHDNIDKKPIKWTNYEDWYEKKKISPFRKAA